MLPKPQPFKPNQLTQWHPPDHWSKPTELMSRIQSRALRPGDKGGNTLRQATPLQPSPSEGTSRGLLDTVSRIDPDFYRIKIGADDQFASFTFANLASRGAISADLLNSRGRVFSFDNQSTAKTINAKRFLTVTYTGLTEGKYYVRITTKRQTPGDYQIFFS